MNEVRSVRLHRRVGVGVEPTGLQEKSCNKIALLGGGLDMSCEDHALLLDPRDLILKV